MCVCVCVVGMPEQMRPAVLLRCNILIWSTWPHQVEQEEGARYSQQGVCYMPLTFPLKVDGVTVFGYRLPCPMYPPREAHWNKSAAAKTHLWATRVSTGGGGEGGSSSLQQRGGGTGPVGMALPHFCLQASSAPPSAFPSSKVFCFWSDFAPNSSPDSINLPPASPWIDLSFCVWNRLPRERNQGEGEKPGLQVGQGGVGCSHFKLDNKNLTWILSSIRAGWGEYSSPSEQHLGCQSCHLPI